MELPFTKFVKILEMCKQFSENLVNESGNVPRRGPVPKSSDLEVVALSLTAETESIDSEKWLFDYNMKDVWNSRRFAFVVRLDCVRRPIGLRSVSDWIAFAVR